MMVLDRLDGCAILCKHHADIGAIMARGSIAPLRLAKFCNDAMEPLPKAYLSSFTMTNAAVS
jgi:hypothetical protein